MGNAIKKKVVFLWLAKRGGAGARRMEMMLGYKIAVDLNSNVIISIFVYVYSKLKIAFDMNTNVID